MERQAVRLNALREAIAFGTHVPVWYLEAVKGTPGEVLVSIPALLLRRVLESATAVRELIKAELPGSIPGHLRTMFEMQLGLKHLVAERFEARCAAYHYWRTMDSIATFESWLAAIDASSEDTASDPTSAGALFMPGRVALEHHLAAAQERVERPDLAEVRREYDRLATTKKGKKRRVEWYHLFGGQQNIRELAEAHGDGGAYIALYKTWSRTTHGSELFYNNVEVLDGAMVLPSVYSVRDLSREASFAVTFVLRSLRVVIDALLPERRQHLGFWYVNDLKPLFDELGAHE